MNISKHAQWRMANRSIRDKELDHIMTWGSHYTIGQQAMAFVLDKSALAHAKEYGVDLNHIKNFAIIVQRDSIITVMHIFKSNKHWVKLS